MNLLINRSLFHHAGKITEANKVYLIKVEETILMVIIHYNYNCMIVLLKVTTKIFILKY